MDSLFQVQRKRRVHLSLICPRGIRCSAETDLGRADTLKAVGRGTSGWYRRAGANPNLEGLNSPEACNQRRDAGMSVGSGWKSGRTSLHLPTKRKRMGAVRGKKCSCLVRLLWVFVQLTVLRL